MRTHRNEHLLMEVDYSVHLLRQVWTGIPTSRSFRRGLLLTLVLADRHQIKRWLIDLRLLRMFNPLDLQWLIRQLSEVSYLSTRDMHVAIILNDLNQFGKLGTDRVLQTCTHQNKALSSRYFIDHEDARQWLRL